MPKLRQPLTLIDLAVERLATLFTRRCVALAGQRAWANIRRDGRRMEKYVTSHVPRVLYERFESRLVDMMSMDTLDNYKRMVIRILMCARFGGIHADFLCYPDASDAHKVTKVTGRLRTELTILRNWPIADLSNLVIFNLPGICTDGNLELLADNCPKLERIDVTESTRVTDAGLRTLGRCHNLRHISYEFCSVTLQGIDDLFAMNGEIRDMMMWSFLPGFKIARQTVHPSIERFKIYYDQSTVDDEYLEALVRRFPNLATVSINTFGFAGDVAMLHSLRNLTRLHLITISSVDWDRIAILLRTFGRNLVEFTVSVSEQSNIGLVHELCTSLKYLSIADLRMEKVAIPSFINLTVLKCAPRYKFARQLFEFEELPELDELTIANYDMGRVIERLIVDHELFPKLTKVVMGNNRDTNAVNRLKQIAKTNNMDLTIIQQSI